MNDRRPHHRRRGFAAALAGAAACAVLSGAPCPGPAVAEEASIVAELSPREIRAGETARLVVRISGTGSAQAPSLPAIDGLDPGSRSQQTSVSIVNGAMSSEVTYSWSLLALRPGDFVIPPLRVEVDGSALSTEPLTLRVLAAGQPPSSAGPGGAAAAGAPDPGAAADAEAPEVAGLELRIPDRELFVGESVPGTLRLLIRDGVRVSNVEQPQVVGDAFTVTRPTDREPDQATVAIGGRTYHAVTFPIAVSPIRPGVHDLGASETIHAVLPRARDRRRGLADDPFSDPFFSGYFGDSRKVDVKARPLVLRVLPLPSEGRPPDFSGAIGRFTIEATASPSSVGLGDPVTQRVTIRGEGNLDRVDLAPLATDAAWKVYPGTSRIETNDPLGVRGAKVFEQAIVPQRADLAAVPTRRFSYFDPSARGYVSLETQPVALTVAPPAGAAAPAATSPPAGPGVGTGAVDAATAPIAGAGPAGRTPDELAPDAIEPGTPVRGWIPLARRPGWLALHLLPPAAALLAIAWMRRSTRRRHDPALRRVREAVRLAAERAEEMSRARARGDAASWFAAARRAVQESVAPERGPAATSLDADAVIAALGQERGARLGGEVHDLFAAADSATYAGARTNPEAIAAWESRVETLLHHVRRPS